MEQDTPETLEATLQQFEAEMRRWGIRGVRSYAYVNGRYKADCLNTVKKHFDLGLTVEKGINQIPYESCRMKHAGGCKSVGRQSRAGWRLADFDDPRMVHDL